MKNRIIKLSNAESFSALEESRRPAGLRNFPRSDSFCFASSGDSSGLLLGKKKETMEFFLELESFLDPSGEGKTEVLLASDILQSSSPDKTMEGEVDLLSKGRSSGSCRNIFVLL